MPTGAGDWKEAGGRVLVMLMWVLCSIFEKSSCCVLTKALFSMHIIVNKMVLKQFQLAGRVILTLIVFVSPSPRKTKTKTKKSNPPKKTTTPHQKTLMYSKQQNNNNKK